MIGRKTDKTPDNEYEKGKYKKLRTYKKKTAEYVSKSVKNNIMFGADSLWEIGGDFCIITEGIADAIMAIQSGFSCISPVATRFRKEDHDPILHLVRSFKKVYICMDNEVNEAGLAGAYATCKHLIDNGVDASIVELPRPAGIDKIDLADYLHYHDADSFRNLLTLAYKPPEFFKPPADQFLTVNENGKMKFSPRLFAEWLVNDSNYNFKSFFDDHEILFYIDGVYRVNGKTMIGRIMEDIVTDWSNNHSVTEVVGHVERMTYMERDQFDANPYMLNLKNCLYDLKSGETAPHTPDHLSLNQLPVMYNPDTKDVQWEVFLEQILPDEHDRHTIREMFGHSLIRTYEHQYWFALTGSGANGKGVTLTVLKNLLGSKNVSSVELQDFENVFASSQMYGKMANIGGDLPARALSSTGMLKKLTGGDPIHAQFKNKPIFEFINYATIIYAANQIPRSPDFTDAFKRRIILVKFEKTIDVNDRIAYLGEKMSADPECLSAVLNFAIQGARSLIENGDIFHKYSEEEMARIYVELSDSVATFLIECVEYTFDDEDVITGKELYKVYKQWWVNKKKNGMVAPLKSSNVFSMILGNNPDLHDTHRAPGEDGKDKKGWKWIRVKEEFLVFDAQPDLGTFGTPGTGVLTLSGKHESVNEKKGRIVPGRECQPPRPNSPDRPIPDGLLNSMKSNIFKIFYSGLKDFNVVKLQHVGKPWAQEVTTELLKDMLDANLKELKLIKIDEKTYKKEE